MVADGFYEWQKAGGVKNPLLIYLKSERSFGFAGLYETWRLLYIDMDNVLVDFVSAFPSLSPQILTEYRWSLG